MRPFKFTMRPFCYLGLALIASCSGKPEPYVRRAPSTGTTLPASGGGSGGSGFDSMTSPSNPSEPSSPPTQTPAVTPPAPVTSGPVASGSIAVNYTTVAPSPGGRYTPSHVQAIFVTDMNDRLIKTLSANPGNPAPAGQHLRRWRSLTNNTADGITGATLRAYGAPSAPVTWDLKGKDGKAVGQGNYKIWFEIVEANTTATIAAGASISTATPINGVDTIPGYKAHVVPITIGAQGSTKMDTSNPVWTNISITHTP